MALSTSEGVTAQEVVDAHTHQDELVQQRKDEAAAAGVTEARFINYAEAHTLMGERSDIESLASVNARKWGTVEEQEFFRSEEFANGDNYEAPAAPAGP